VRDGKKETHGPFPNLHDLGRVMLNQGCRPEELLALAKRFVDLRERTFRILRGKSQASKRRLDMTEESLGILTQRMRGTSPWIFPGRSGDHATKLNNAHNAVLAAAGFAFVIYDFRHTFATRMAKAPCLCPYSPRSSATATSDPCRSTSTSHPKTRAPQ
jgi:integrase